MIFAVLSNKKKKNLITHTHTHTHTHTRARARAHALWLLCVFGSISVLTSNGIISYIQLYIHPTVWNTTTAKVSKLKTINTTNVLDTQCLLISLCKGIPARITMVVIWSWIIPLHIWAVERFFPSQEVILTLHVVAKISCKIRTKGICLLVRPLWVCTRCGSYTVHSYM